LLPIGSDLLASLTSTFDQKLKSLLSATTVEAVANATPTTETEAGDTSQEHSTLPQENDVEGRSDGNVTLPVSAGGNSDMSRNNLLETSEVRCTNDESVLSVQPAVAFTAACTTLFRDPSLHRGKSAPVDCQGKKDVSLLSVG
jgi:hypothetical protein